MMFFAEIVIFTNCNQEKSSLQGLYSMYMCTYECEYVHTYVLTSEYVRTYVHTYVCTYSDVNCYHFYITSQVPMAISFALR